MSRVCPCEPRIQDNYTLYCLHVHWVTLWKEVMWLLTDHDVHLLFMKWSVAWRVSREVCNLFSHSHWRYGGNWNLNVVGRQIIEPIHGELKFMCRGSMQNQDFCFSLLKLEYHNFFWVSETGVEWSRNYQKTAESLNILFGLPVYVIFWYHNRINIFITIFIFGATAIITL